MSLHYGFEQLDQSRPLGEPPLLQMALELPDQRDHERPGLRIDRVRRPGDIDHADDALVERIADHRGGAAPRLGHFAEVLLGMDVQWPAQCQRRAYRIRAAGVLMPGRAGNDMVGGHAVGEMRITVDRQQRAVRVAGDQDGARAHEIGNDRRHAGAHRVIELGVAELEAIDIGAFDPQRRRFRRRVDAVAPAAAPRFDDDVTHHIVTLDRTVCDELLPDPADGPDVVLRAQSRERDVFHRQAPPDGCQRPRRTAASALRDEMLQLETVWPAVEQTACLPGG